MQRAVSEWCLSEMQGTNRDMSLRKQGASQIGRQLPAVLVNQLQCVPGLDRRQEISPGESVAGG